MDFERGFAMNIRETLRSHPQIGMAIAAALVVTGVVAARSSVQSPGASAPTLPAKIYFSDDDGKTFFADDSARVAPFDHDGKKAYQAAVFRWPGGQPFVGYLLAYTPAGKAALEALPETERRTMGPKVLGIRRDQALAKRPGDTTWAPLGGDAPVGQILNLRCPDGSETPPEQIVP
jgi:hypothetical protein